MKKILFSLLLTVMLASAQAQLAPKDAARPAAKGTAARVDNCAPIGRTANGDLVYSIKCENTRPPSPPPQARIEETTTPPPPQPKPSVAAFSAGLTTADSPTSRGRLLGWKVPCSAPGQIAINIGSLSSILRGQGANRCFTG
jgi:hypothetical protein